MVSCSDKSDTDVSVENDSTDVSENTNLVIDSKEKQLAINNFIGSLQVPSKEPVSSEVLEKTKEKITEKDGSVTICDCQKFKVNEEFNESILLDASTTTFYPGSILEGNSVLDGSYQPISVGRAPLTISTDFFNKQGDALVTIDNPTHGNVLNGIKSLLYDCEVNGSTAANTTFEIKDVYSKEQLDIALGTNAKLGKRASISESFKFNDESIKTRVLVKYIQVYYTVYVDVPSSPSGWFAEDVTIDELHDIFKNNLAPVYVSNVKYGRAAYFAVTSSDDSDTIKNELNAQMKFLCFNGNIKTSIKHISNSKETTISGTIIGGSGTDAANSISGLDGLSEYIKKGGNFSKESPAAPIAYTLSTLSDNKVFSVVSGTEYVVRNCHSSRATFSPVYIEYVEGPVDYFDVFGEFYFWAGSDRYTFWLAGPNSSVRCRKGEKTKITYSSVRKMDFDIEKPYESIYVDCDIDANYGSLCSHNKGPIWFGYDYVGRITIGDVLNGQGDALRDEDGHFVFEMDTKAYKTKCPGKDASHFSSYSDRTIFRCAFDINF